MAQLTTKIPIAEKIAELEQRIAALEKKLLLVRIVQTRVFGNKLRDLWRAFDRLFDFD